MGGNKEFDFEGLRKKLIEEGGFPKVYFLNLLYHPITKVLH